VDEVGLVNVDGDKVIVAVACAWNDGGIGLGGSGGETEHGVDVFSALGLGEGAPSG
jgi:hypothetical protein